MIDRKKIIDKLCKVIWENYPMRSSVSNSEIPGSQLSVEICIDQDINVPIYYRRVALYETNDRRRLEAMTDEQLMSELLGAKDALG